MTVLRKVFSVIGILASLSAAEGLHRFGGFISMMHGKDGPFYTAALIVSLVAALFFVLSMVGKLSSVMKWLCVIGLVASAGLMLLAPSLPVIAQIGISLIVAVVCMLFAPVRFSTELSATDSVESTSKFGKVFKIIAVAVVIVIIALVILGKVKVPKKPQEDSQPQQTQERTQ